MHGALRMHRIGARVRLDRAEPPVRATAPGRSGGSGSPGARPHDAIHVRGVTDRRCSEAVTRPLVRLRSRPHRASRCRRVDPIPWGKPAKARYSRRSDTTHWRSRVLPRTGLRSLPLRHPLRGLLAALLAHCRRRQPPRASPASTSSRSRWRIPGRGHPAPEPRRQAAHPPARQGRLGSHRQGHRATRRQGSLPLRPCRHRLLGADDPGRGARSGRRPGASPACAWRASSGSRGQIVPSGIQRVKAWTAGATPGADINANVAVLDTGIGPADRDGIAHRRAATSSTSSAASTATTIPGPPATKPSSPATRRSTTAGTATPTATARTSPASSARATTAPAPSAWLPA